MRHINAELESIADSLMPECVGGLTMITEEHLRNLLLNAACRGALAAMDAQKQVEQNVELLNA